MEHYVTLFDSLFLPQGLALHLSLERHAGCYTLWILCVDKSVLEILEQLRLPNVRLLDLEKIEPDELKHVRPTRSKGEYCWTLTPFSFKFVFEADCSIERVTYVDADCWLRKSPDPIFTEFEVSEKHVLITDHGYAPEFDMSKKSGKYCVQFMTFTRSEGEGVRKWWGDQCIQWCFARYEKGKFGDQKYLDDWPIRFQRLVHVLERLDWTLAPWNGTRFSFDSCIVYHFQGLRVVGEDKIDLGPTYGLPKALIENIYCPYTTDLLTSIQRMKKHGVEVRPQIVLSKVKLLRRLASGIYQQCWRFFYKR